MWRLLFFLCGPLPAATLQPGFWEAAVASGFIGSATAFELAPDGRIFVCEQTGAVRVIKNGVLLTTPFVTFSVDSVGERGLLGIAFDPDFNVNQYVYFYYTVSGSPKHNRVVRVTASGDVAQSTSEVLIFRLNDLSAATNHNGGAIHFGADGKLYVGVGENATGNNSQTLTNLLGKMLRINKDGSIPLDNPFLLSTTGDNRAIWTLGLRNPFTFAVQPGTGRILINDVGESTFEEIDDGIGQSNYGWPATEGPTNLPQFRSPLHAYGHGSGSLVGCAISGGTFYNPQIIQFPWAYLGKYFFADLCSGWIRQLDLANNTASGFVAGISAPVDLKTGPDGSLYYLSRGIGMVFRITWNPLLVPDKAGIFRTGFWPIDINRNWQWDANDKYAWLGQAGDIPVVGDFDGDSVVEIGIFRSGFWAIDINHNGLWDAGDLYVWLGQAGDIPVVGDFDGDGRDEMGVFRSGFWAIDMNHNGQWDVSDKYVWLGQAEDVPVVGDFNGDRIAEMGVFRSGLWAIDVNRNGVWDAMDKYVWLGQAGDVPVVGDFNGDGIAEMGVFRRGFWAIDLNRNGVWDASDGYYWLGETGDVPVVSR